MKRLVSFSGLIVCALLLVACGGGGDGDSTTPTLDRESAESAYDIVEFSHSFNEIVADDYFDRSAAEAGESTTVSEHPASLLAGFVRSRLYGDYGNRQQSREAAGPPVDCEYGGTMTQDLSWEELDPPVPGCLLNLSGIETFESCGLKDDVTLDGVAAIEFTGNSCQPDAFSIYFTDFTISNTNLGVTAESESFSITVEALEWEEDRRIHANFIMDGDLHATSNGIGYDVDFDNLTVTTDLIEVNGEAAFSSSFSGSVSAGCLSDQITFETLEKVIALESAECPQSGRIKVSNSSGGFVIITFDNGSVTVGDKTYNSCTEIPKGCIGS